RREAHEALDVVLLVQAESAVLDEDRLLELREQLRVRLTEARQARDLALVPAALEAEHLRARRVELAERVRIEDRLKAPDRAPAPHRDTHADVVTDAVRRHDERFLRLTCAVRARSVCFVVLDEVQLRPDAIRPLQEVLDAPVAHGTTEVEQP